MADLIDPNWHPIFVHFVVAFLLTAPFFFLAAALAPASGAKTSLLATADWMLALGVVFALSAVGAGLQAYYTVAHDEPSHLAMTDHRNFALATAGVFSALGLWRFIDRKKPPTLLFALILFAAASLLATTAWKGGRLVYHYGLGVDTLPEAEGPGHSHDHGATAHAHDDAGGGDADDDHDHGDGSDFDAGSAPIESAPAPADVGALAPRETVAAFHAALANGDAATVEALVAPDAIIAESGGAERSFAEYAGHHMAADMEFSKAMTSTLVNQAEEVADDVAWVISEWTQHGEFRGRNIHSRTMETMALRRTAPGWRIAHIHWSSAEIKEVHEH
ncbi:MAG: DUF2231 domain-containing protein [Parvularculaceae bacterium]